MSEKIGLVFDTGAGHLPSDEANDYIEKVKFSIYNNQTSKEWLDKPDLDEEEDYQELLEHLKTPGLLKTSQPTPQAWQKAYQRLLDNGYDKIIAIPLSKALSGSFNSADSAADDIQKLYGIKNRIVVVDSKAASVLQRAQVDSVSQAIEAGETDLAKLSGLVQEVKERSALAQIFQSLRHLKEGGRGEAAVNEALEKAKKIGLMALELAGYKAIIGIDSEGNVKKIDVIRKEKNAQEFIKNYLYERMGGPSC